MFDISSFMPHGMCFLWQPGVLWTHVISDAIVGMAYLSIPLALLYYKIKARNSGRLMNALLGMFMAFIVLCGLTHLVSIWTIWEPVYYLQGMLKALTALVSIGVAATLWPLMPRALAIPSPNELKTANFRLDNLNRDLADQVRQATSELRQKAEDLEKTNAELRRSNADLDDFAYIASHDLRSPLRGIDNLASWIAEDCGDDMPESSREDLQTLRGRIRRMDELLEGLLQYSRIGRGEQSLIDVDLNGVVRELDELLDKPADYRIETVGQLPTITTWATPLKTVLRNLVANSIKHRDSDDGHAVVASEDSGKYYRISVTDDGPGIPQAYRNSVFGLFKTLKPRDEIEGSGLGLAIVKRSVEFAGGSLDINNAGTEGKGVTVSFTWPKENFTSDSKNHAC